MLSRLRFAWNLTLTLGIIFLLYLYFFYINSQPEIRPAPIKLPPNLPKTAAPKRDKIISDPVNPKKPCPTWSPHLRGPIKPIMTLKGANLTEFSTASKLLQPGGSFTPEECIPKERVAILIPFRNRSEQLDLFLVNLHPLLQRQLLAYSIFVIEQLDSLPFNRGLLFNIGFLETPLTFDCFIFSDVDLLPEHDHNLYNCPGKSRPRHMSLAVDTLQYRLPYHKIFGGVAGMTRDQFKRVNGFGNKFWGWGGEDDNMSYRIRAAGMKIFRPSSFVARYKMIYHEKEMENPLRHDLLNNYTREGFQDGLTTLRTFSKYYKVQEIRKEKLYTLIRVNLKL